MRKYGTGSIFQRRGYFYLRMQVKGKVKSISLRTKNRREAEKRAKEIIPQSALDAKSEAKLVELVAEARGAIGGNKIEIADVWSKFKGSPKRSDCKEQTLNKYERAWNKFAGWLAEQGIQHLGEITPAQIENYFMGLDTGPAGYNRNLQAVRYVLRIVGSIAGISQNPAKDISKRREKTVSREPLTPEQIKNVFEQVAKQDGLKYPKEWLSLFKIGAFTGLRLGDAVTLNWSDVDLLAGRISVVPEKTSRSNRRVSIPIHPDLAESIASPKKSGDVLPNLAEHWRRNPHYIGKMAVKIIRKALKVKVPPKERDSKKTAKPKDRALNPCQYGFHSLRHGFVTQCAKSGVPLATVQKLVGHGSPVMTEKYFHLDDGSLAAIKTIGSEEKTSEIRQQVAEIVKTADSETLKAMLKVVKNRDDEGEINNNTIQ